MSFSGIEKYIIGPYLFKIPNVILVVNLLDLSMIPQLSIRGLHSGLHLPTPARRVRSVRPPRR